MVRSHTQSFRAWAKRPEPEIRLGSLIRILLTMRVMWGLLGARHSVLGNARTRELATKIAPLTHGSIPGENPSLKMKYLIELDGQNAIMASRSQGARR